MFLFPFRIVQTRTHPKKIAITMCNKSISRKLKRVPESSQECMLTIIPFLSILQYNAYRNDSEMMTNRRNSGRFLKQSQIWFFFASFS